MIEPGFRILLTAAPVVQALVTDRLYFNAGPQDERRPRLVLTLISSIPGFTFEGRGGYVKGRMQITALAPTYPEAKQLVTAVRDAIDAYSGTVDDTEFGFILTENTRDIPAVPFEGRALPTFGVSIDAKFLAME